MSAEPTTHAGNRRRGGVGSYGGQASAPMQVVGYVRVSTDEQTGSGAGLEAQRRAIVAECKRRGWEVIRVIEDAGYSAKDLKRPGVQEAMQTLEAGEAGGLRPRDQRGR